MSVWYWQGTREAGRPLRPLLTESVPAYSFHSFCVRKWKKSCKNHLRSQSYGTHDSKPLKRKIERKIPFSCAFFSLHFKEFYSSLRTTATTGEETDNLCILLAIYYFCLLQNSGQSSFRVGQIRISLGFRFSKKKSQFGRTLIQRNIAFLWSLLQRLRERRLLSSSSTVSQLFEAINLWPSPLKSLSLSML